MCSGTVPDAVGKNPVLYPNPVRCQHVPAAAGKRGSIHRYDTRPDKQQRRRPADHKIGDRKPVQILSCRQQIHHRRDAACIIGQQFLSPAQGNAVSGKKLPCAVKISHGRAPRYQPAAADR